MPVWKYQDTSDMGKVLMPQPTEEELQRKSWLYRTMTGLPRLRPEQKKKDPREFISESPSFLGTYLNLASRLGPLKQKADLRKARGMTEIAEDSQEDLMKRRARLQEEAKSKDFRRSMEKLRLQAALADQETSRPRETDRVQGGPSSTPFGYKPVESSKGHWEGDKWVEGGERATREDVEDVNPADRQMEVPEGTPYKYTGDSYGGQPYYAQWHPEEGWVNRTTEPPETDAEGVSGVDTVSGVGAEPSEEYAGSYPSDFDMDDYEMVYNEDLGIFEWVPKGG